LALEKIEALRDMVQGGLSRVAQIKNSEHRAEVLAETVTYLESAVKLICPPLKAIRKELLRVPVHNGPLGREYSINDNSFNEFMRNLWKAIGEKDSRIKCDECHYHREHCPAYYEAGGICAMEDGSEAEAMAQMEAEMEQLKAEAEEAEAEVEAMEEEIAREEWERQREWEAEEEYKYEGPPPEEEDPHG